jgi:hypothetical protein
VQSKRPSTLHDILKLNNLDEHDSGDFGNVLCVSELSGRIDVSEFGAKDSETLNKLLHGPHALGTSQWSHQSHQRADSFGDLRPTFDVVEVRIH